MADPEWCEPCRALLVRNCEAGEVTDTALLCLTCQRIVRASEDAQSKYTWLAKMPPGFFGKPN